MKALFYGFSSLCMGWLSICLHPAPHVSHPDCGHVWQAEDTWHVITSGWDFRFRWKRETPANLYSHDPAKNKWHQVFLFLKININQKYHWKLLFLCWIAPPSCSLSFHCEYWQRDNGPMAAPGIPRLWPRLGEAELELVLCPRTMGGTMGAGPASILLPLSLWGQRRPGFVLDCEGQCDGQSRGWCPARLVSAPLLHSDIPVIIFISCGISFCFTKTDQNNQSWQLLYEN